MEQYNEKYKDVPRDYKERLDWMIEQYHITPSKMQEIINKKQMMESCLYYQRFKVVLYESPEGALRPRGRIVTPKNYMNEAIYDKQYLHVYSPNAADDNNYLHRLIDDELVQLNQFIQTQCIVTINAYIQTPSIFNSVDTFLAEIGLHRKIFKPDWDNIGKKYSDMFNANVWLDDSLTVDGRACKYYSILPRIEIYISYLNYATNAYQYQSIVRRKDYREDHPINYLGRDGRPML